ncbi:DUF6603 domain-containing protein [Nocardiopsis alba]|uniref:DUF6603 domain-containing protein n=1 Tax=Nocardiopsis alba TaxID=53437 RepID=UPI000349DD37|nr:DUF6603 domain-containing protein [Nocardiopsis alba]
MAVTYGDLKSWLDTVKINSRLDLTPNRHDRVKGILDLIDFAAVDQAAGAASTVVQIDRKSDLSLTGTLPKGGLEVTLEFTLEDSKSTDEKPKSDDGDSKSTEKESEPADTTPVTGVSLTISLDTDHSVWGALTDVGLKSPKLVFAAEKVTKNDDEASETEKKPPKADDELSENTEEKRSEATEEKKHEETEEKGSETEEKSPKGVRKRLTVELVLKTSPELRASCELGFEKKKRTSYLFRVARADKTPFSLVDALSRLGMTGVDEFGRLLPSATGLRLDYTPGGEDVEVMITADSTEEEEEEEEESTEEENESTDEDDEKKESAEEKKSTDDDDEAPEGFTWGLALLPETEGKRPLFLSASFPLGDLARLSRLDLVEGQVPNDADLSLDAVTVIGATAPIPEDALTKVGTVLEAHGAPKVPGSGDLAKGLRVGLDFTLLKEKRSVVALGRKKDEPAPYAVSAAEIEPAADDPAPVRSDSSSSEVQRPLGPLHIDRVGLRLAVPEDDSEATRVLLDIDAALVTAGFELRATGLAIGLTITKNPRVTVELSGLGATFSRDPLTITGAFVKRDRKGYAYDYEGLLLVKAEKWGLLAVGSYARLKDTEKRPGYTSLFVFGGLAGKIAGPPPVVFTGLALGGGYNSRVELPEADGVSDFPFVQALADMPGFVGDPPDPLSTLEKITGGAEDSKDAVVLPEPGDLWFTAGVAATIAETVAVQALLIAQFGPDDFSVALLGAMNADFPAQRKKKAESGKKGPKAPATASEDADTPRVAHIELGFRALYEHAKRRLALTAALSDNSWVIHPDCKLTGGAAVYVWFPGSDHAGDFVATVGGYHPAYRPPAHYPQQVPRLGLDWSVSSDVRIKGELYAAVTPKVGMVGGRLSVDFVSGGLHAWLDAGFDAIVRWAPLYFELNMWVSIGASYTARVLWWDVTIRAEVGAYLNVWGPPTGGTVRVEVGPFSKSIDFGEPKRLQREPLPWADFHARQLPADPLGISPMDGLLIDPTRPEATKGGRWLVSTDGFSFSTRSALPSTRWSHGDDTAPRDRAPLTVGPMGDAQVAITQHVKVTRGGTTVTGWDASEITGAFPMALWAAQEGSGSTLPGPGEPQTVSCTSGIQVSAPPPTTKGQSLTADGEAVQFSDERCAANPLNLIEGEYAADENVTLPEKDKGKARTELEKTLKKLNLLVETV